MPNEPGANSSLAFLFGLRLTLFCLFRLNIFYDNNVLLDILLFLMHLTTREFVKWVDFDLNNMIK